MSGFATFADMRIRGTARRAIVLSAAAVLGAGLVTGCTPDPPTTAEPTVSGTRSTAAPSPSASPTVNVRVKPERPDAWDDVSVDGAIAVAEYFLQLYPYSYATGDVDAWQSLSHPECVFCADVNENIHDMFMAAHRAEGGSVSFASTSGREVTQGELFSIDLQMTQAPSRVIDANSAEVEGWSTEKTYDVNVLVLRDGDRWQVRGIETHETPAS